MECPSLWSKDDFCSQDAIYRFFEKHEYSIGDRLSVPASDVFKSKPITEAIKNLYLVVDEEAILQVWLIEAPEKSHLKPWRYAVANAVKGKFFDILIIFTEDYQKFYFTSVCGNEIENDIPIYDPSSPCVECDRLIDNLANRRPIIDSSGLMASVAQARHELYAENLLTALNSGDSNIVKIKLSRVGLKYGGKLNFFLPRNESPLKSTLIDVIFTDNLENHIKKHLAQYCAEYLELTNENLQFIIILNEISINLFDNHGYSYGEILITNDEEIKIKILTSLITYIYSKVAFNSQTFEAQFGPYSPFFFIATFLMKKFLVKNKSRLEVIHKEWLRNFSKVYRLGDLDEELYLKHTYLSLLIKIVLFTKYLPEYEVVSAKTFEELSSWFEKRNIELFLNDFYSWAMEISQLVNLIFKSIRYSSYEADDIFRIIYQDMVSPSTRHALGEFYTPQELARLMVDDTYILGNIVLDPACGSGTFLIEIINKIRASNSLIEEQVKSINNLYGFDVNPIAVLVAKANLLLHCEELYSKGKIGRAHV